MTNMQAKNKTTLYDVLSPDGISIHHGPYFRSVKKARETFRRWLSGFEAQGYYSSNNGRIPIEKVKDHCCLKIISNGSSLTQKLNF